MFICQQMTMAQKINNNKDDCRFFCNIHVKFTHFAALCGDYNSLRIEIDEIYLLKIIFIQNFFCCKQQAVYVGLGSQQTYILSCLDFRFLKELLFPTKHKIVISAYDHHQHDRLLSASIAFVSAADLFVVFYNISNYMFNSCSNPPGIGKSNFSRYNSVI